MRVAGLFSPLLSSLCAIFSFFLVSYIFNALNLSKLNILLLTLLSVVFFIFLFRKLPDVKITNKVKLSFKVIFIRAILATLIIVFITSLPQVIGEKWAGFLSGFPITLFPLILIIHITYQKEQVHTIIKNFPKGIGALIIYALSVHTFYPLYDIYLGTLISFVLATVYLFIVLNSSFGSDVKSKD